MASSGRPEIVRVWIVAEDPLVRGGLATALAAAEGVEIVAQLAPSEVPAALQVGEPESDASASALTPPGASAEVVVWDLGPRPLEADEDTAFEAAAQVLALVAGPEDGRVALGRGAAGALRRDAPPGRIAAAVRSIASGLVVLDHESAATISRSRAAFGDLAAEPLTPRELEVLQQLAGGLANKEIARLLGISEHTVKFHVNSILAKLGAQGRTEAVVRAARLGLVVL